MREAAHLIAQHEMVTPHRDFKGTELGERRLFSFFGLWSHSDLAETEQVETNETFQLHDIPTREELLRLCR